MNLSNQIIIDELTKEFFPNSPGKVKGVAKPEESFPINVEIKQAGFLSNELMKIQVVQKKFNLDLFIYTEEETNTVTIDLYLGKDKFQKRQE